MQLKNTIPDDFLTAVTDLLGRYVEGLTPDALCSALTSYRPGAGQTAKPEFQKPMTKQEVAKLLGVSLPTVDRLLERGKIKRLATGLRRVAIDRESVAQLLKS